MFPKIIFLVPYRDRKQHLEIFSKHMENVLSDLERETYRILYIHQTDSRPFNRGAMKNIGFLYVKETYPEAYKEITLVFNDVDTMPKRKDLIDYKTTKGIVKHHYGFAFTLGGILSMNAGDFEVTGGFPNFWSWGYEDNALQKRVLKNSIEIDRSKMYEIGSKDIIHLKDEPEKMVNKEEYHLYRKQSSEGYKNIIDLEYRFNGDTGLLDILSFNTGREINYKYSKYHKMSNGNKPFKKRNALMGMIFS